MVIAFTSLVHYWPSVTVWQIWKLKQALHCIMFLFIRIEGKALLGKDVTVLLGLLRQCMYLYHNFTVQVLMKLYTFYSVNHWSKKSFSKHCLHGTGTDFSWDLERSAGTATWLISFYCYPVWRLFDRVQFPANCLFFKGCLWLSFSLRAYVKGKIMEFVL